MKKIMINFNMKKDAEFYSLTTRVIAGMTNNPNFPGGSDPDIALIIQLAEEYRLSLAALDGSHENTEKKEAARKALELKMKSLGSWVENHSSSLTARISSGFDISKDREAAGPLEAPMLVLDIDKKAATASCAPIAGAKSYLWEVTETPVTDASVWTTHTSTKASKKIENLVTAKEYAFRVAAIGTDPSVNYSEIILSHIL